MFSFWRLFAYFAVFLATSDQTSTDWQENSHVMDFAIGIHYDNGFTKPEENVRVDFLKRLIDELIDAFTLSEAQTRMAIVEFGTTKKVLLPIQMGANRTIAHQASDDIGKGSYTAASNFSVASVARLTREMIFPPNATDRVHVPKLVTVITVDPEVQWWNLNWICKSNPVLKEAIENSAHAIVLEGFTRHRSNWQYAIVYALNVGYGSQPRFECFHKHAGKFDDEVIKPIVEKIELSLKTCVFKESKGGGCYQNHARECVYDIFYELAYKSWAPNSRAEPEKWGDVELYCFKNGSTPPCKQDTPGSAGCKSCNDSEGTWSECNATCDVDGVEIWHPNDPQSHCPTKSHQCIKVCTTTEPSTTAGTSSVVDVTATTSVRDDDDDYYYYDDPIVVNLRRALIGLGIAVAIGLPTDVVLVLYVCRIRKEELARSKLKQAEAAKTSMRDQSSVSASQPGWTVVLPPEMTVTPSDDLIKEYAKKKG